MIDELDHMLQNRYKCLETVLKLSKHFFNIWLVLIKIKNVLSSVDKQSFLFFLFMHFVPLE